MSIGFRLHDTMIYRKENYVPLNHNRYEQCFEYMFIFSKGKPKTFNPKIVPCKGAGRIEKYGPERRSNFGKEHSIRSYHSSKATKSHKIAPNIFTYVTGQARSGHPAAFPDKLAQDHILTWSNPGDLVFDPFGGSGTVAKTCHINGRDWILSEISDEYVELANERLKYILRQSYMF